MLQSKLPMARKLLEEKMTSLLKRTTIYLVSSYCVERISHLYQLNGHSTDAVKDPRAAIAATVEDWLENYRADEDSRGQALADLVNFVLRVSGIGISERCYI